MSNEPKKRDVDKTTLDWEEDYYPGISNIVSASECTGMMYAPPQNEDEQESYSDMFSMQIPKEDKKEGKKEDRKEDKKE